MNIWLVVGIALIAWCIYEIFTGSTWIHRKVTRAKEPTLYWVLMVIWTVLALWALYVGLI